MSRITRTLRMSSLAALAAAATMSLVAAAPAGAAATKAHAPFAGQLYIVSGTIAAAPAASPTTLSVQVSGGNRAALRALVGNESDPLTFAVNAKTSYVAWTASARGNAPSASTADAMKVGDPVHLRIRARYHATLANLVARPVRIANDFAAAQRVTGKHFVFEGKAVAIDTTAMTITIDVKHGSYAALNALLGQSATQTFHYDPATLFISWTGRTPHSYLATQIKPGDRITLRTRAGGRTPLAALLAAPLWKVNDREPASSLAASGGNLVVGN
jgi:hypothetical protein